MPLVEILTPSAYPRGSLLYVTLLVMEVQSFWIKRYRKALLGLFIAPKNVNFQTL